MKFKHKRNRTRLEAEVHPIIFQPVLDTEKNGLCHIYYGPRNYTDVQKYRQEVSLVFRNETLPHSTLINRAYEVFRRVFYGRRVDIETFFIHVEFGHTVGLSFPGIYSGQYNWRNTVHLDTQKPAPVYPVKEFTKNLYVKKRGKVTRPHVYVNTWNHALANFDNNPEFEKQEFYVGFNVKGGYLSRVELNKKYRLRTVLGL